jgi:hypothetical protein
LSKQKAGWTAFAATCIYSIPEQEYEKMNSYLRNLKMLKKRAEFLESKNNELLRQNSDVFSLNLDENKTLF